MKTGFKGLDEIIDLDKPQLILLVDACHGSFAQMLSGDIANNITLKQELPTLEIIDTFKEYLIKRLVINECNVTYNNWYPKKYTDEEFIRIGRTMTDLIETTKRLPTILEKETYHYERRKLKQRIYDWANDKCIVDGIEQGLVVFDMGLFRHPDRKSDLKRLAPKRTLKRNIRVAKDYIDQRHEQKKYLKVLKHLVKICHVPIVLPFTVGYDFMHKPATVNDIEEKFIVDGVDTIVILNDNEEKSNNDKDYLHFDVIVHTKEQEQKCTLKYTPKYRRFED